MLARPLDVSGAPITSDKQFANGALPGAAAYCSTVLAGDCSKQLSM